MREIGARAAFLILLLGPAGCAAPTQAPEYQIITDRADSAQPAALAILKHLASGELEQAAALSNAPQRRLAVLRDFRSSIGDESFKRLFGRYFAPENRVVMEAAIGRHRLLVWDLGEAGNRLAGQYFVEVDGSFLMDDVPSPERASLQRILEAQRKGY